MSAERRDITSAPDSTAVAWLVGWACVVFTAAGEIEPLMVPKFSGFALRLNGAKKAKVYATALPAVRALRKAGK